MREVLALAAAGGFRADGRSRRVALLGGAEYGISGCRPDSAKSGPGNSKTLPPAVRVARDTEAFPEQKIP
jgi:hypothetical protein